MIFTLKVIPKAIKEYLVKYRLELKDIDLFVLHQANKYILENLHKKTDINEKGIICLEKFGNTVSSSIPIALANNIDFKNKQNIKILLVGFGVGLSWGITTLRL